VVVESQNKARQTSHDEDPTAHLAVGAVSPTPFGGRSTTRGLGVNADAVANALTMPAPPLSYPLDPLHGAARRFWNWTFREALRMGHNYMAPAHPARAARAESRRRPAAHPWRRQAAAEPKSSEALSSLIGQYCGMKTRAHCRTKSWNSTNLPVR